VLLSTFEPFSRIVWTKTRHSGLPHVIIRALQYFLTFTVFGGERNVDTTRLNLDLNW
jgi:hypothetical protein